jgi:hypothetical protein
VGGGDVRVLQGLVILKANGTYGGISDVRGTKEDKNQYRYLVIGVNGGFLDTV